MKFAKLAAAFLGSLAIVSAAPSLAQSSTISSDISINEIDQLGFNQLSPAEAGKVRGELGPLLAFAGWVRTAYSWVQINTQIAAVYCLRTDCVAQYELVDAYANVIGMISWDNIPDGAPVYSDVANSTPMYFK